MELNQFLPDIQKAVNDSVTYLKSDTALKSIERDPYWPKWDSPWWHMLLLYELGLSKFIPEQPVEKIITILKKHYLPIFPLKQEEFPKGIDPYRQIACHCALGSIYQVLFSVEIDVDQELSWIRPWFLKYQLPDGGLNCDEAAYTKVKPKSSFVSTLPCLEAILFCTKRPFTEDELGFLDQGAQYLIDHKLFRRESNNEIVNQDWLEIKFPNFYEYDFLRGYYFLVNWSKLRGISLPETLTDEVEELVQRQWVENKIILKRHYLPEKKSYNPEGNGTWKWREASTFSLCSVVSGRGKFCEPLTQKWLDVKSRYAIALEPYNCVYHDPIKLKKGDIVCIEYRETELEWKGWVWCTDQGGKKGWISERYIQTIGNHGTVLRNYDASELSIGIGEKLKIYYEEFGWAWCRNTSGNLGWAPMKNLNLKSFDP